MIRRGVGAWIAICLLPVSALLAQERPGPEPLTLEAAVERAMVANPRVRSARLRRDVELAAVRVARERPNPEARLEFEREAPTRAYTFAVPLETGGKRHLRIAVGEAAVRTGEAELAEILIDVRAEVRRAYFGDVLAEGRLTLLGELQSLARRALDAAQQRFDAGSAPRLEVLQAELALAQADNEATAARAIAVAAHVRLNALLGLPLDVPTALSTPIDFVPPLDPLAAITRMRAANVELAVLDRRIEEQRVRIGLARALQLPDVTSEAAVTRGQPEFSTGWRASVEFALPLFTRHRAGVQFEEAMLTELEGERDATLARITGEVVSGSGEIEAQRQQYVRYRDEILPQALEVERMAEDSYRLGQTGIAALLQALQASRDVRLRSLQIASDFQGMLTDLERAIGVPIP